MAGTTGLEPAASAVTGQRSNQLNYVPNLFLTFIGNPRVLGAFLRFIRFACVARFNPIEPTPRLMDTELNHCSKLCNRQTTRQSSCPCSVNEL
jgi:hypothetical protein